MQSIRDKPSWVENGFFLLTYPASHLCENLKNLWIILLSENTPCFALPLRVGRAARFREGA